MEIFDMFDGLCPEPLPLDDSPIDTNRVMGLVRAEVKRERRGPRRLSRAVRTVLIAAALAAFLGVTAYAAYELFIDRYVIDQPAYYETEAQAEDRTTARISLTGYQGTPEYAAYIEWEAWQSDWHEKTAEQDPWQERGVDDSWHETPDNYAGLYGASFQDQADVLDAIVEKYGLTLHQDMAPYYRSTDLYEDLSGDRTVGIQMFVNAKGSFATISGVTELTEDCEAWQYTTKSGRSVDLYLASGSAEIMTESEGAYMELGVLSGSAAGVTKEDLQTIADSVDFAILADRFDGAAHPETADMLPVLKERETERFSGADLSEQYDNFQAYAVEELGRYAPSMFPAEFADMLIASQQPGDELGLEGGELLSLGGAFFPSATEADGFSYYRVLDCDVTAEGYPGVMRAYLEKSVPSGEVTDEMVQGRPAVLAMTADHGEVWWYDESADLLFSVSIDMWGAETVDRDAVLALAGSVEKVE